MVILVVYLKKAHRGRFNKIFSKISKSSDEPPRICNIIFCLSPAFLSATLFLSLSFLIVLCGD